jgi:hypothetical protein
MPDQVVKVIDEAAILRAAFRLGAGRARIGVVVSESKSNIKPITRTVCAKRSDKNCPRQKWFPSLRAFLDEIQECGV